MPKNFSHRLKNIIKESLGDFKWINDVKSNQDIAQEIADDSEIKDSKLRPPSTFSSSFSPLPSPYFRFSAPTSSFVKYCEEQYGLDVYESIDVWKRYGDIIKDKIKSDDEELDESLEWSDKDTPFDEKDKSFENDPSWKDDEDWSLNPERSYWKQGDAGGSGGGDINESDELDWIKDVKPDPLTASPDVFFRDDDDMYYTLDQLGHDTTNMEEFTMAELAINYGYRWSEEHEGWYHRDEVSDFMGGNFPKGVRRGIDESDDFEWASGFAWSKEMLDSMLTDCKTLRVTNFNVPQKQPYQSAGGPSVMFLTRCKDWWDYLNQLPLDDNGRGPSEWFTPEYYDRGHYGIIWNHYWRLNKKTPTLEMLDDEYTSAITTEWGYGIERQLNGTSSSEAWFVVDENNKPIYDLIPENVKGYAKIYEEYFFGDKINESNQDANDDFEWAKETNPIQCKDLKGYYFYYGTDPRKFIIGGVSINSGDELKVHYKWYDQHSNKDDWGKMGCDTLIHRVKLGSYNLYDTDDKEVNQRDLAYTDNTFDDDVRKEIWEQGEIDWVKETPLVTIGGKGGYPKENVPLGTKVISRSGEVFTIEDITGGHMDFQHVWGREISPAWVGPKNDDDNKNWHNTLWLRRTTPKNLNESEDDEWEWAKTTQPVELEDPKSWVGRSFGYGQELIDQMSDDKINASDDEEYFTITGVDVNGNLTLIKNHPIYGENYDSTTSPSSLRDYISKYKWVWK